MAKFRHGQLDSSRLGITLFQVAWATGLLLSLLSCRRYNSAAQSAAEQIIKMQSQGASGKLDKEIPIYQYYNKIPKMSGVTNDPENLIFNLQIELGYEVGDVKTLEKLNKYGVKIAGEVRQSIAAKTKIYLGDLSNYSAIEKDILDLVNKIISPDPKDKARVKDIIISELFLHDYR